MANSKVLEPVINAQEAEMAKVAQRCIMAALDHSRAAKIVLVEEWRDPQDAPTLELPPQALRAIADLLGLMGQQQPVMLIPQTHELSTQEAAGFLNVSRPYVVKLIEEGALKCRRVGRHRRVEFQDLVQYQRQLQQRSEDALQRLTDLSQELGESCLRDTLGPWLRVKTPADTPLAKKLAAFKPEVHSGESPATVRK